jgi:hypothetical protein
MTPQSQSALVSGSAVIAIFYLFVRKAVLEETLAFRGDIIHPVFVYKYLSGTSVLKTQVVQFHPRMKDIQNKKYISLEINCHTRIRFMSSERKTLNVLCPAYAHAPAGDLRRPQ